MFLKNIRMNSYTYPIFRFDFSGDVFSSSVQYWLTYNDFTINTFPYARPKSQFYVQTKWGKKLTMANFYLWSIVHISKALDNCIYSRQVLVNII